MSKRAKTTSTTAVKQGQPKTLLSLFLNTPAGDHIPRGTTGDADVAKQGPVMVLDRYESLPRVFRKLAVEGFLGAPVTENGRYVGFIDMMDLVLKTRNLFWGDTEEMWVDFWDKEESFQMATVDDIMTTPNTYARDPFPPMTSDFTTFAALETIVRNKYHRIVVLTPGLKTIETILTQSMLISWLRQHKSMLGHLRTLSVGDMINMEESKENQQHRVITISEDDKAMNAFNRMANESVSGLAVVDADGILVSGISIRDLRGVGSSGEYFHRLFRPIKEFKKLAREEHPRLAPRTHYSNKLVPRGAHFVTKDDTIEKVIDKMYDGNIHRVFVCDNANKPRPIAAIAQYDILKVVFDHIKRQASSATDVSMGVCA